MMMRASSSFPLLFPFLNGLLLLLLMLLLLLLDVQIWSTTTTTITTANAWSTDIPIIRTWSYPKSHHRHKTQILSSLKDPEAEAEAAGEEQEIKSTSSSSFMKDFLMPNGGGNAKSKSKSKCNPSQMSPTSLAYIGDSVFELFIRSRYVWPNRRTTDLQKLVVAKVRAETQSILLQSLLSNSSTLELTPNEQTILSRGRNAGSSSGGRKRGPKRLYGVQNNNNNNSNKNDTSGGPRVYQDSTALEALIGYVYLTDEERCVELMQFISDELDQMDEREGVVR